MIIDIKNCFLTDLDFLMDGLKKRVHDMFSRIPNLRFFFQDFLIFFLQSIYLCLFTLQIAVPLYKESTETYFFELTPKYLVSSKHYNKVDSLPL